VLTEVLKALAFAVAAVVLPGLALQRLLCRRVDPALVLPGGFVVCAALYGLSLVLHLAWLFPAGCAAAALVAFLRKGPIDTQGPGLRGALPVLLGLVLFLALTRYGLNRRDGSGDFLMDAVNVADATFHVGLTWELTLGYPPQVPGLSGFELNYHFGSHLIRAAALQWAGLHPYSSLARLEPTLAGIALLLTFRALAFRMGLRGLALALAPWGLLAADASFWLALFPGVQFWVEHLKGNLLTSLVVANSQVAGLAMLAGVLLAFDRHREGEGRGWLGLALVLAFALPFFKVFLAAPLLAAVAWTALREPRRRGAALAVGAAATAALVVLAASPAEDTVEIVLDPLAFVRGTAAAIRVGGEGLPFAVLAIVWIATGLGLRWLGVPAAFRALGRPGPASAAAVMALVGWPVGLLVRISPRGEPSFNDAFYFLEAAGAFLWIFTAQALAARAERRPRALVLALAAALAVPGTVEFVLRKRQTGARRVPAGVIDGMAALARETAPGEVVLERPHTPHPAPPLVFIGRRIPYTRAIPYFDQFATGHDVEHRLMTVRGFFQTASVSEARAIASALGVRYVCLYEGEGVEFPWEALLEPVYENPAVHVYRVKEESTALPLPRPRS
jgi:hypothetical protein